MAVKRKFIPTRQLKTGMKIDQAVTDATGRALIAKGAYLDDFQIEFLMSKGGGIFIAEGEPDPDELEAGIQIPEKTREVIEKVRVEDRSKVKLKEDVKKRVGEGIQYLFKNTDSQSFIDETENVSNELLHAITDDDAVAIDISILKVSDEYTFKHSVDVATMAMIIGKNYGLTKDEIREIGISGLLHDVGKSKVPTEILNKPAKLDEKEFEIMKNHSLLGYNILKENKKFPMSIMSGVLQHHEKINGTGYPMGVTGDKIGKYAKIIAVADVYDALVTERPYKTGFAKREAIEMIMAMTQELDIKAMKSFLKSVILYPVDSVVKLSNGQVAKVVENNPLNALRPKVVEIETGTVYDLASDIKCASILIM